MFSGIVIGTGVVHSLGESEHSSVLGIEADFFKEAETLEEMAVGDSVAVSGVCLTVIKCEEGIAYFDLATETRRCTTLGELKVGDLVNLECSLRLNDRLHGHFVQGHVDCVTEIMGREESENTVRLEFALPEQVKSLIVPKGGLALDGISFTVGEVTDSTFSVYVIPHTLEVTTLKEKGLGDRVNIEIDILARYVQSLYGERLEAR